MRGTRGARWSGIAALGVLLVAPLGCISVGSVDTDVASGGYRDERGAIEMVTAVVGGVNVFLPSTVVVTEGSGRTLKIFNATDAPHGFQIPALQVEAVLEAGVETVVALPPLVGGHVYELLCHLHPPHRGATLMVVRGP